jgi:hypothetical protein
MKAGRINVLVATLLTGIAGWCGVGLSVANAEPPKQAASAPEDHSKQDMLIFRSGTIQYGTIISETDTMVKFKGSTAGIEFTTDFPKSDILEIKRAAKPGDPAPASAAPTPADIRPAQKAPVTQDDGITKKNIYWLDLTGEFGGDISETPIRAAMKDAHKCKADVIVIRLDAESKQQDGSEGSDDTNFFDGLTRCEKILPIFATEMPTEWGSEMPRMVIWVKHAMSGAAFMPFVFKEIYFTTDGKMGGIGNLGTLFEGVGDYRVQEKQRSLRLAHAEGWANLGGYDYRLIRAMARVEYVLSVRFVNGKPELFEGYPSNPGEELLTDDGKGEHADTLQQRIAGEGNDVLTLNARIAKLLGVSKGTVDTQPELLAAMGLDRSGVIVPGRSKQIMNDWSNGLDNAKRQFRTLIEDVRAVKVQAPGDYAARTKARGTRIRILEEMKGLSTRWGEGLEDWFRKNGIPSVPDLDTQIETIKLEQMKDKK